MMSGEQNDAGKHLTFAELMALRREMRRGAIGNVTTAPVVTNADSESDTADTAEIAQPARRGRKKANP